VKADFHPERHFTRRELRRMDRASQMLLMAAREAVADSRLDFSLRDPRRCGVLVGTTLGGMISGERYHRAALAGKRRPGLLLDFPAHAASDRVAITFDLQGPSMTFSTACASGAHAIGYGFDLIRAGRADVMLAGGFDTMAEFTHAGFGSLQALIKVGERIRPFDRNRTGFALGEGAAVLVLEDRARARPRGDDLRGGVGLRLQWGRRPHQRAGSRRRGIGAGHQGFASGGRHGSGRH
jgi:3-oxoacyl-[acyl-carrier-protein] synthase II